MLVSICRRSGLTASQQAIRSLSVWSTVPAGPPDPILGMYVIRGEGNVTSATSFRATFWILYSKRVKQVLPRHSKRTRIPAKSI